MTEIWKDIKGYEGLYQVSNLGKVKSLARFIQRNRVGGRYYPELILKPTINIKRYGYLYVHLHKKGVTKVVTVHRLVAEAFISNPNNLPEINHKDENKSNNCVDNLEWCTSKYNANYGNRNLKMSQAQGIKVVAYNNEEYLIFNSQSEAGRVLGVAPSNITNCVNKYPNRTLKGYRWKKFEEAESTTKAGRCK